MHPTFKVPDHPGLAIGLVVAVLVLTADLRGAIGFSSFGVLRYYRSPTPRPPRRTRRIDAGRVA